MRFWILIMALVSLGGCFTECDSKSPAPANQSLHSATKMEDRQTLVFLGDSLTSGYGLNESDSFPSRVERLIEDAGLGWRIVNAGVSGDTTRGGLERLDWVLRSEPDAVFVALGANDGLRGLDLRATEHNLRLIVSTLKARGVKVFLAGMRMPDNYGQSRNEAYAALFESVASSEGVPFLPFLIDGVALNPEMNQADGIHPNEQGAEAIAERVFAFLEPHLK